MTKKQKTLYKTAKIPVMNNRISKYKLDMMARINSRDSSITNKIRYFHVRYETLFG